MAFLLFTGRVVPDNGVLIAAVCVLVVIEREVANRYRVSINDKTDKRREKLVYNLSSC